MAKQMIRMLIIVGILLGLIFGYKAFGNYMMKQGMAKNKMPPMAVSAMTINYAQWQPNINATATINAINGVDVTTEVAGIVQSIKFIPGSAVKMGDVLVQLNADTDLAQLKSLQATANLSQITYTRDKAQYAAQAISKQIVDTDAADFKSKTAQVAQQAAFVDKKTIRAPFTGRLGISAINLGQYLNPGNKIVTLQSLDPIYADFYIPQQQLVLLKMNEPVILISDSFPGTQFSGKITTIEPKIDPATRNVEVEATISNPQQQLLPGMFATLKINTGSPQRYLTLPQSAISFNPYGDIVYIVKQTGTDPSGKPLLVAEQTFVTLGETRGDQVAILTGLKEGDEVITSGQLKLNNDSPIILNNSVVPGNNPNPEAVDE